MENCKNHTECVSEITAAAHRICAGRKQRLTPLRQRVLEIVSSSHRPIKAYDILSKLSKTAKPPTVYRTLDFLIENGLIHKLSSVSSYSACFHAASGHRDCFFLLCSDCGDVEECCNIPLSKKLNEAFACFSFTAKKMTLEVRGVCSRCSGGDN